MMKKKTLLRWLPLLLLVILVGALAVSGVFASLIDSTTILENKFQSGALSVSMRGSNVVSNDGNTPCLTRVKLIINWIDEDNNVLAAAPEGAVYTWKAGKDWTHIGKEDDPTDGYWYYNKILKASASSTSVIEDLNAYHGRLEIKILTETVQAAPAEAAAQLWPEASYSNGVWKKR